MSKRTWNHQTAELARILGQLRFSDESGTALPADEGFNRWRKLTLDLRDRRGTVYLIGNGASASMASHFAADLAKNARLSTQVFSDLSLLTAISNDMGYDHVFAEPLRRRGQKIDMLVAISSSGKSPNILSAVEIARELGITVVTLSGMSPTNPLQSRGALNLYVPADSYSMAESCHAAALHWWIDLVQMENYE
jgi:D-sedoheptulose 7-phosphate isomerase